jgi:ABC-type spermidine/putrescine transport system permease subunit I
LLCHIQELALASGITLVFLPILKIVSVPEFLISSSSGSLIGDIIMEERLLAQTSDISLVRTSALSFIVFILVSVGLFIY